jgi:WD40 repeat protein
MTGSADNTARLWDLSAKDPAANPVVLRGHEDDVNAVAISPDNHWLVTGSADKTARLWFLQMRDLINLARITVRRNFSAYEWQLYFPGEHTVRPSPNTEDRRPSLRYYQPTTRSRIVFVPRSQLRNPKRFRTRAPPVTTFGSRACP